MKDDNTPRIELEIEFIQWKSDQLGKQLKELVAGHLAEQDKLHDKIEELKRICPHPSNRQKLWDEGRMSYGVCLVCGFKTSGCGA